MSSSDGKHRPEELGALLKAYLKESGLAKRVEQAEVVPEWPRLVGPKIQAVTKPLFVTPDGTLFVAVITHSWMTELQLMERDLLQAINEPEEPSTGAGSRNRPRIRRLRFQLMRKDP